MSGAWSEGGPIGPEIRFPPGTVSTGDVPGASHWTGESSRVGGWSQCAPIFFLKHQKENGRTRSKEKMFRRVGPHTCGPPAAGGGRLAVPRGNQGRKRAALGVIQAWGSLGYRQRRFYPQGVRRIRKAAEPQTAAQSLPLAFPRGTMERQRGQKQGPCVDHSGFPPHRTRGARPTQLSGPARAGRRPTVFAGTGSEDPRRAEGHCTGARQKSGLFFWTVHGPFSFPQDGKENGGWNGQAAIAAESSPISHTFRKFII